MFQFDLVECGRATVAISHDLQVSQHRQLLADRGLMSFRKARQLINRLGAVLKMTNDLEPDGLSDAFQQHSCSKINFLHCHIVN